MKGPPTHQAPMPLPGRGGDQRGRTISDMSVRPAMPLTPPVQKSNAQSHEKPKALSAICQLDGFLMYACQTHLKANIYLAGRPTANTNLPSCFCNHWSFWVVTKAGERFGKLRIRRLCHRPRRFMHHMFNQNQKGITLSVICLYRLGLLSYV